MFSRVYSWFKNWLKLPEPPPPVLLRTERLLLRDLEAADLAAACVYRADPETLRHLARTAPYSRWEVGALLRYSRAQRWQEPRAHYNLGMVVEADDLLIGECELFCFTPERDEAVLGFQVRADYWNRGYATEAARALLRFGFLELGLDRISAGCTPENDASRRVLQKAGLIYMGTQEEFLGSPADTPAEVYSISREEWLARHGDGSPADHAQPAFLEESCR